MSESRENALPFTVPKLCIKRVPADQASARKQNLKLSDEGTSQSATTPQNAEQPSCSGGGLKLVLRVPKDPELSTGSSATEFSEENSDAYQQKDTEASGESSNMSNQGPAIESTTTEVAMEELSGAGSVSSPAASVGGTQAEDASAGTTKRRRKRKRFRLTIPAQKTKAKASKQPVAAAADKSTRDSPSPQRAKLSSSADLKKKDKSKNDEILGVEDVSAAAAIAETSSAVIVADPASPEEPRFPSPPPEMMVLFSPLQLLLDHLLRGFLRKDPERYFAYPVTEDIAPNYSAIVSKPMDFVTIRKKIDANEYNNLQEFKADINLISLNAMAYNDKNTIYYIAAKKLKNVAEYMFSKEKLTAARKWMPELCKLTTVDLGCTWAELAGQQTETKKAKLGYYSCIVDDMCPEEILEQVRTAAAAASQKLNARYPNTEVLFAGAGAAATGEGAKTTTTLKMLLPEHTWDKEQQQQKQDDDSGNNQSRPVVLGDLVPKLKEGNPGLWMPEQSSKDSAVPVTYLDNGPFSSFAPYYDSTWATLNKEDSDLLLATFGGDEQCVRYVDSVRSFFDDKSEMILGSFVGDITAPTPPPIDSTCEDDNPSTQCANSDQVDIPNSVGGSNAVVQQLLDKNSAMLQELQSLQTQRLSSQPQFVLTHAPGPSAVEINAAAGVTTNLRQLVAQTTPGQLVAPESVREAIFADDTNNHPNNDDYNMDVLREFLMVDDD